MVTFLFILLIWFGVSVLAAATFSAVRTVQKRRDRPGRADIALAA